MENISIKNIYWMLVYAFRSLTPDSEEKINSESFDNIYELLCVMFCFELSKQIKRGLTKEYISVSGELNTIRGKISITETINNNSLLNNKLFCEYDEFSNNSYLNRIIKTACNYLLVSNKIKDREKICKLKNMLIYFKDVNIIEKNQINWDKIKYDRNNKTYKLLINISYLLIEGLIVNKEKGNIEFRNYVDDQKMHKLYEKFILEYFIYHHKELSPSVSQIEWNVENNEYIYLLPKMKTDIVLACNNKKLIIDAKYYSKTFQNNPLYNKDTYRSNNLYQIFTYVKNEDKKRKGNVSGMLLYVKTDNSDKFKTEYKMDGNDILILNLDFSKDFETVKNGLEWISNWIKKK